MSLQGLFKILKGILMLFIIFGGICFYIMVKEMYPEVKASNERQQELNNIHENEIKTVYKGKTVVLNTIDGIKLNFNIKNGVGIITVNSNKFKHVDKLKNEISKCGENLWEIGGISCTLLSKDLSKVSNKEDLYREDLFAEDYSEALKPNDSVNSISQIYKQEPFLPVVECINPAPDNLNSDSFFYGINRKYGFRIPKNSNYNVLCISVCYAYGFLPQTYNYVILK